MYLMNQYEYVLSDRPEIMAFLPEKYDTVLEIGCAKGGFKASLRENVEIWGVEPNPLAAKSAAVMGYKVLVGTYDMVADNCPDEYFDLIICNDVIEHMVDHEKFLNDIKKKMKRNGLIVGSIPNVRYFGNLFKLIILKDWKYEEQGILDRTHLRFFTGKSLYRTFLNNNFEIQRLAGVNSDFRRRLTIRQLCKNTLLLAVILLTFGFFRDLQYLQYGFRLKLPG